MDFTIVDTENAYRRMLDAPDAAARQSIFDAEIATPFAGLAQLFGGPAAFATWGMQPETFADRAKMQPRLDALAGADAWNRAAQALVVGRDAFAAYADRIPTPAITFGLVVTDTVNIPGSAGYARFGAMPGWIMTIYSDPTPDNLLRVEAATVHELHHNILAAVRPPKNFMTEVTVADYMLMEGLAESFAAELYGADKIGPWVTDFDDSNLDHVKAVFREGLNRTGFNTIRSYIFGDDMQGFMGMDTGEKLGLP